MAKSFPSDFYVTCATVIPVLYLAVAIQGGTYKSMLRAALHAARKQPRRSRDEATAVFVPVAACFTLGSGILGEAFALVALFDGSDTKPGRVVVLIMTLILVAVAGLGPAARWWRVQGEITTLDLRQDQLIGPSESDHEAQAVTRD